MSKLAGFKQLTAQSSSRMTSHAYLTKAEFDSLVGQAAPLYRERLSSVPFYRARMQDEQFWVRFVGSRVQEARVLVAASTRRQPGLRAAA
ncbi:hypothetical protein EEB15_17360 [Ramlibacter sp. WS9]|nr:hypothetical protein EEB15_17360 [Ramlibacter sp. WS9]